MTDSSRPRVSIVTPTLNQAPFLEQTLRSVLDQGYPDLEYIVIDGGSTDGTVDILRRYEAHLAHWVSEPDLGQADAINKGFARATGDLIGYLNSDDLYEPGCLARVVADFVSGPDRAWHAYPVRDFSTAGLEGLHPAPRLGEQLREHRTDEAGSLSNDLLRWVLGQVSLHQPGVFWRREQWAAVGGFDLRYHYAFDRHFFMRLIEAGYPLVCHGGAPVALFRLHDQSKTGMHLHGADNRFVRERMRICDEFEQGLSPADRRRVRRVRTEDAISRGWKMFREGAPRLRCCLWLGRLAMSRHEALRSRYFWASATRFLVRSRPARRVRGRRAP